jgi:hypothetical protein
MKEFKGTPAPWKAEKLTASGSYFLESSQGCLGTVWASSQQEANAHLIAACPKMHAYIVKKYEEGCKEAEQILRAI